MAEQSGRLIREKKTALAMLRMYCKAHHSSWHGDLCDDCRALYDIMAERVDRCPFRKKKPPCPKCTVKCYTDEQMERIRTVMRYAGPRMMRHHPWLAFLHIIDGKKKMPVLKKRAENEKE